MASVMADPDGVLYYTNDSGKLFAIAPFSGGDTTSSGQTTVSSPGTTGSAGTTASTTADPTADTNPASGHSSGSERTEADTVLPTAPLETTVPADPSTGETGGIAVWLLLAAGTGAAVLLLLGRRGRTAES